MGSASTILLRVMWEGKRRERVNLSNLLLFKYEKHRAGWIWLGWFTGSTGFRLVAGGNFEAVVQVPRTFILIQVLAKLDGITGVSFCSPMVDLFPSSHPQL